MTAQEVETQIADVEAEINSIWDEGLMKLMDSCKASKEQLKINYGNNADINAVVDLQYLATIRGIRDLARRRKRE